MKAHNCPSCGFEHPAEEVTIEPTADQTALDARLRSLESVRLAIASRLVALEAKVFPVPVDPSKQSIEERVTALEAVL